MSATSINRLSVASLVLALLLFSFVAAILGHISLKQITSSGARGRRLALAAVGIGWMTTIFLILAVTFPERIGYGLGFLLGSVG